MAAKKNQDRSFGWRWAFLVLLLIIVLTVTLVANNNHDDNSALKVSNTISIDDGDTKINWTRYGTTDVELSDSLEITKAGIYHLTGAINDGYISINVSPDEPVKIILDNVTIHNSDGPAIACYEADDLVIELVGDNALEDSESYSTQYDVDVTGTIYSKADLTFQGDGTLNLTANYLDGIVGKDDLKFISGAYIISANDDAIRGKDSVYVIDGTFSIMSGADAIKSTNEFDVGKGFVLIKDGNFDITSDAKGIKATNSVLIYNGTFSIDSFDDSLHSNNYVGIMDGEFMIDSGDDGVHADKELIIDGGTITISRAYEGLEAQIVTINGGRISLTTNDDGINAGGGADESANNRPGAGMFDVDEDCYLSINGGDIYINSAGDGVDSNGHLVFNGGVVVVDGPTNNGNGALDSGAGIVMNGGSVIAVGASGMAETLGATSNIHNISVFFTEVLKGGTLIEIKDSNNNTILGHTSAKTFNHLSAGSDKFVLGNTYAIYINGEKYTDFTISDITTVVGQDINRQQETVRPNEMKH